MENNTKNAAFIEMVKAMQLEAANLVEAVNTAAADLDEGRRNGAIGALCALDESLERLAAFNSAMRALHRLLPQ